VLPPANHSVANFSTTLQPLPYFTGQANGNLQNLTVTQVTLSTTGTLSCIYFTAGDEIAAIPCISLYPNPANGVLTVESTETAGWRVTIHNVSGEGMSVKTDTLQSGWKIDCSELPDGIYILQILTDTHHIRRKLIVQHGL
jgi:hypothetical protein